MTLLGELPQRLPRRRYKGGDQCHRSVRRISWIACRGLLPIPPDRRAAVEAALAQQPPCRFETARVSVATKRLCEPEEEEEEEDAPGARDVVLDVAHNPQAMETLCRMLQLRQRRRGSGVVRFVLGMSVDKDLPATLGLLFDQFAFSPDGGGAEGPPRARLYLTQSEHPRAATAPDWSAA